MSSPSARLLELLSLLQARPHWNAPELAERLGITERTVRRDIHPAAPTRLSGGGRRGPHGRLRVGPGRRPTLVARDLDRRDWRTFRLDRMAAPALTGHRFVRTEEPDVGEMVARGLTLAPYRWQAEVVLATDVAAAESEIPRTIGSVEEVGGETILRIGANEVEWLAHYVAGLPFDAEVRSPPQVRAALRALGRRLQAAHRARPPRDHP